MNITYKQTPNISGYTTKKVGYVLHGTLGSYTGAVTWLCTPPNKRPVVSYSSAHYVIAKDGRVTQLAKDEQVTWHAGLISKPTWRGKKYLPTKSGIPFVPPFKNPNDSFIGIEFEWFQGDKVTEQQFLSAVEIIKKGGIINPAIICHKEITDYKSDFQDLNGNIDMSVVQEIIRRISQ